VSGSADLVAAMAAFAAAGVTHVGILIGVNDGRVDVPVATWKANVLSQAAALVAAGYKVLLLGFQCPWVPATVTPAEADLIRQYVLQYPSMADGVNVLAATGSLEVYDATALAPTALIGDGLHPNTAGVDFYGRQWALAFYQALYGTGTGGFATIGCGFIRGD
jgi:lysophospholipase L1-like esterase